MVSEAARGLERGGRRSESGAERAIFHLVLDEQGAPGRRGRVESKVHIFIRHIIIIHVTVSYDIPSRTRHTAPLSP